MFELREAADAQIVDRLTELERLKSAAAAEQARLAAELHERRSGGRAVAHEVALARQESPYAGREHLALALALVHDLPETLAALDRGEISERRALIIARESAHLLREDRELVDATLGPLAGLGDREVLVAVRRRVFEVDPEVAEARGRRARARRRVTLRRLSDGMARVTAELSASDAVLAVRSLDERATVLRASGDPRTHAQLMADELVDRLNQPAVVGSRRTEIQVVMSAEILLGCDVTTPAHLAGYGPVARREVERLLDDPAAEVFVRRVFANPTDGGLVAMDSRATAFPPSLRRLIFLRDGETCRTRWCDAPVRHADHVHPRRRGGATDLDQGQGLCEACNYAKEDPGWVHRVTSQWPERHTTEVETPTGHRHRSRAPAAPVRPKVFPRLDIVLAA
ncbi:HNH endonuclease [Nocardioides pyridinolyticus]